MHVSAVTFLAPVISPSSYSLMTLNTASRIFTLDNGVLLLSLKLVLLLISSKYYFFSTLSCALVDT